MKFILVNHRTPLDSPTCAACSRPLASGYLKAVSTRRQYCDHDCYVRDEANLLTPWIAASSDVLLKMTTLFVAASCCYSIELGKAALLVGEWVTAKSSDGEGRRKT